jgi:hypothetical protein
LTNVLLGQTLPKKELEGWISRRKNKIPPNMLPKNINVGDFASQVDGKFFAESLG